MATIIYGANLPVWMQPATGDANLCFTAQDYRSVISAMYPQGGVLNAGDFTVQQHGSGDNTVDITSGTAIVAGTTVTHQGSYLVWNASTQNLQPPTPPTTNPRLDAVVLSIEDGQVTGTHNYRWILQVVSGAEASTPVLPTLPASSILLAVISRTPGVTNLLAAAINVATPRADNLGIARFPAGGFAPDLNSTAYNGELTTAVPPGGFYAATLNNPAAPQQAIIFSGVSDANNKVQLAVSLENPPRMYVRSQTSGTWNAWVPLPTQPTGSFATSALAVATHADGVLAIAPALAGIVSVSGDTYTVIRAGWFSLVAAANIAGNISFGTSLIINGAYTLRASYMYDWSSVSRSQINWDGMLLAGNTLKVNVHNNDASTRTFTRYCWLNYNGG
jgi:hypothetical protein